MIMIKTTPTITITVNSFEDQKNLFANKKFAFT